MGVPTYRRPVGLRRTLEAIAVMECPAEVELRVIVVDNDDSGSGRAVVEACSDRPRIDYLIEPRRGVSYARNTALEHALSARCDWIGWIDDDEAPAVDWLVRMLDTQARYGADVVFGPNEPVFEDGTPDWIRDSGFFHLDRFQTGERYPFFHTRTSGVLLRAGVVPPERFDERMSLTGGEDRLFFTLIHRAGGTFVYDRDAVVTDWVPESRARLGWLLRRWYRTGMTRSLTMLYLDAPRWPRRIRRLAGGLLMALQGLARAVVAIPRGRVAVLRNVRLVLIGIGSSIGALGFKYHEYQVVHGR